MSENGPETCEICAKPFASGETCAIDIELGTVHAECLDGSPIVYLDTGEPSDGPLLTFPYEALSALQAPSAPAKMGGWKLVPVEPTEAMLNHAQDAAKAGAGMSWNGRSPQMMFAQGYAAMLEAAPAPAPDAEKDEIARLTREAGRSEKHRNELSDRIVSLRTDLAAERHHRAAAEARATELEGQVAALVEGLQEEECWHEGQDKAISKQPNANEGSNGWMRCMHQERLATIRSLLARIQPALNGQEAGR